MKDTSYGIIPCKKINGSWHVLLAQHVTGNWWGFPKGHAQKRELPKAAAERELYEETSLTVENYLTKTTFEENYSFLRNGETIEKTVIYYLAQVCGKEVPQQSEISDLQWVALELVEQKISYEESRSLLRQVRHFLDLQDT